MGVEYVVKVPEPVLTTHELSEAVGRLTQTCETLRADIVALEDKLSKTSGLRRRIKAWLRERLSE